MQHGKIAGIALAAALVAAPALAQTASHTAPGMTSSGAGGATVGTTGPGTANPGLSGGTGLSGAGPTTMGGGGATSAANAPSSTNPVLTDGGNVRASKVIGSSVYNDKDEKIGSVDDIILGTDSKPAQVVLSVGGFLGLDAKLVQIPYSKLQFGDTTKNSDNRVIMPGATKDALTNMPTYRYAGK